jgi:hypothetical protein
LNPNRIRLLGFKIRWFSPARRASPALDRAYNDDIIEGWVGVGSQLDGIGIEHVYDNGNKLADFGDSTGLKKLGVGATAGRTQV